MTRQPPELGDVHALVDAADDVQQRRDDPQITRGRRLAREQPHRTLVYLQVAPVDPVVVGDDRCGQLKILEADRLKRAVQLLRGHVQTAKRLLLELLERFSELGGVLPASRSPDTAKGRLLDSLLLGENLLDDLPSSVIVPLADATSIRNSHPPLCGRHASYRAKLTFTRQRCVAEALEARWPEQDDRAWTSRRVRPRRTGARPGPGPRLPVHYWCGPGPFLARSRPLPRLRRVPRSSAAATDDRVAIRV